MLLLPWKTASSHKGTRTKVVHAWWRQRMLELDWSSSRPRKRGHEVPSEQPWYSERALSTWQRWFHQRLSRKYSTRYSTLLFCVIVSPSRFIEINFVLFSRAAKPEFDKDIRSKQCDQCYRIWHQFHHFAAFLQIYLTRKWSIIPAKIHHHQSYVWSSFERKRSSWYHFVIPDLRSLR